METLTTINGNGHSTTRQLPELVILAKEINDIALEHVAENTGLNFLPCCGGYSAQPIESNQIARLLLTYNFKTQYHDNDTSSNTLYLKFDHHTGFKVDSICFDCCKHNGINTKGLTEDSRLAC